MATAITRVLQTQAVDTLSAAFLAPGTTFGEDNFSSEGGVQRWFWDDSHKEHAAEIPHTHTVHSRVCTPGRI